MFFPANPLNSGYSGEDVLCYIPHVSVNFWNSSEVYWGPLLDISLSGMPYLANWAFMHLITLLLQVFWAISSTSSLNSNHLWLSSDLPPLQTGHLPLCFKTCWGLDVVWVILFAVYCTFAGICYTCWWHHRSAHSSQARKLHSGPSFCWLLYQSVHGQWSSTFHHA